MSDTPILQLKQLTKRFGSFTALSQVSFAVQAGEVVGFVGANGAGKTTAISLILGFSGASSGQVTLFGQNVLPANAHKLHRRIGYASGDMSLPVQLSGRQYLSFVQHQTKGDHSQRYEQLCHLFQPQLDKKISALSRGNKQKIALIAAFITNPDIYIFDEPTSGLDPVMQDAFLNLVREAQTDGKTVFMSSHYLTEVADVCSRIILMREGKIVQDIDTRQLLTSGGKEIKIVTGYSRTLPPKEAQQVERRMVDGNLELRFTYNAKTATLQHWLAGVKQLQDMEVTEHGLENVFSSLYENEREQL